MCVRARGRLGTRRDRRSGLGIGCPMCGVGASSFLGVKKGATGWC
jgi:hypothetical protein